MSPGHRKALAFSGSKDDLSRDFLLVDLLEVRDHAERDEGLLIVTADDLVAIE